MRKGTRRAAPGKPMAFIARALSHQGEGCLEWPYGTHSFGYGVLNIKGRLTYAHVLVCEKIHGHCPAEKAQVAHSCGNPICVNPNHLRWATVAENQNDRIDHGTSNRGERHGRHKLTEKDVRQIRSSRMTHISLGEKYGVHPVTIGSIKSGKLWSWFV